MKIAGIDISKKTFDVCYLIDDKPNYSVYDQNEDGYNEFLKVCNTFGIEKIGFEATGTYSKKLENFLVLNGITPYVLTPLHVSHFIKSTKIKGKTDKSDSYGIARFLSKQDDLIALFYPVRDLFKPLTSSILQLDKQVTQLKNLKHSLVQRDDELTIISDIDNAIKSLADTKKTIYDYSVDLLKIECPESVQIVKEVKGVGFGVLLFVLPSIYDHFDKFTMKQLVSFVGIAPVSFQSGTSVNKRSHISRRGDNSVRKALFLSAIASIRSDGIARQKFDRMVSEGKPKKVALMAIMKSNYSAIISILSRISGRAVKK
jgi:transposase